MPAVVFDANFLTLLLHPTARAPQDPTTGRAVEHAGRRIEMLVHQLSKDGVRIIIPTPVLSEFLVIAGDSGSEYVRVLDRSARFEIAAFDQRAAIENAAALLNAIKQAGRQALWVGQSAMAEDQDRSPNSCHRQSAWGDHLIFDRLRYSDIGPRKRSRGSPRCRSADA